MPPRTQRPPSASDPPPIFGRFGHGRHPGDVRRANDTRAAVARLWAYLRRNRGALAIAMALVVVSSTLGLVGPYLMGVAIDRCIVPRDLPALAGLAVLMLAIYGSAAAVTWAQAYVMAGVAQRTIRDVRSDLFAAIQGLPLRYIDRRPHGDLMSRLTNDVDNISQVLGEGLAGLGAGVIGLLGAGAMMVAISPPLAVAGMVSIFCVTVGANSRLSRSIREGYRLQQAAAGKLNGFIEETVGGQKVVKAYGCEGLVQARFDAANQELRDSSLRAQIATGYIGPLMNFTGNVSLAVVAGFGGWLAVGGALTVGGIASFITYARHFSRPIMEVASLYNSIQGAIAGAERVFEVIDAEPEADSDEAISPTVTGDVAFEDVTFAYETGTPVLRDVSLQATPGDMLALIGPTGAGKTTVANLLTRFYDVDEGRIVFDGHDVRTYRRDGLRRQLGIVLQDPFLFTGTVMENLRYGRLGATDQEVVEAATLANAHGFILRLPHAYDTELSERGSNLSQGQRQLIAIARAILAEPRVLILDEATSSVDTRTERHIQDAMRRMMTGRTSFVIAHRLSTIRTADQILVIEHGRIVERGTHAELLARRGAYHSLCTANAGEAMDEEPAPAGQAASAL